MRDAAAGFVDGIPDAYDECLGPVIFADFAADLARRVAAGRPRDVLELAAGTGIVTRQLRDTLPEDCRLVASDLNPPMLEVARRKFGDSETVSFEQIDATQLAFADASFDTVACQFGVMFFPDKEKSYHEVHRTLRPGGRYIFSVWDSWESNPFARITHEAVAGFFSYEPPGFYHVPFGYHQVERIEDSLSATGFAKISSERLKIDKEIPSAAHFAKGLVFGNPPIDEINNRGGIDPEEVRVAVANALAAAFGSDPGRMPLEAIVISAEKV